MTLKILLVEAISQLIALSLVRIIKPSNHFTCDTSFFNSSYNYPTRKYNYLHLIFLKLGKYLIGVPQADMQLILYATNITYEDPTRKLQTQYRKKFQGSMEWFPLIIHTYDARVYPYCMPIWFTVSELPHVNINANYIVPIESIHI